MMDDDLQFSTLSVSGGIRASYQAIGDAVSFQTVDTAQHDGRLQLSFPNGVLGISMYLKRALLGVPDKLPNLCAKPLFSAAK